MGLQKSPKNRNDLTFRNHLWVSTVHIISIILLEHSGIWMYDTVNKNGNTPEEITIAETRSFR